MKFKSAIFAFCIGITTLWAPSASAVEKPVIESFKYTPNEIDLTAADTKVNIELIVSHPSGISNMSVIATLSNSRNDSYVTYLTRIDTPVNLSLSKVTFKGSIVIPRDVITDVYNFTIGAIKNNPAAGYQFEANQFIEGPNSKLIGGEFGLQVRSGGDLNLKYDTFVGPTYDTTSGTTYKDSEKFNASVVPIWKVGETFLPSKYYELRVPTLSLGVTSSTPLTCASDGKELKLLKVGLCAFVVSTTKTKDYLAKQSSQTVMIASARTKPVLIMDKIANQTSRDLPKAIEIFRVFSESEGYVLPKNATPSVCISTGFFVRILSGGTCTITYQTSENASFLASDLFSVSFEISRDPQTITFSPTSNADIASKNLTLTASASGGGAVTYTTSSTDNCTVSGSTLNLIKAGNCIVTASQAGTATLAPISASTTIVLTDKEAAPKPVVAKKTITCVKGKASKKVTGTNPKCPAGYKLKK
jgi:hypothetical protein